ncbi:hypothetical protein CYMTET_34273 [Cymbomonas tetramitiformis]|uniref:phosphatidate cytidylyltransferase n=1 Tax=Cymbomonas tetramitiformis TaxID=36881 RepID=A0AAE0KQC1_9CHLO|nr:hypothetical protein CYMTET_34273 [Cymbomonas tetramitiformis]
MRESPRRRKPNKQEISAGEPELPPEREPEKATLLVNESATKKWQSFRTRFVSSVCMVGGFFVVLYFGHVFVWALVSLIQTVMVHELYKLAQKSRAEKDLPGFRFLQWYFFATMVFFVHGRFVRDNLQEEISQRVWKARWFGWLLANHLFVSYMMYVVGFVMFVVSLKKGHLLYQFGQFGWTHMILLTVLAQSSFFVANIFEGLFW